MARVLLFAVALDVIVGRFGIGLIGPRPMIGVAAVFARSLVAVLALLTSLVGTRGLFAEARRFPPVGRALVAVTSGAFLAIAGLAVAFPLPGWLAVHVYTTFVAAIASLLSVAYVARAHPTARTGVYCLAVAPLAYGTATILSSFATALPPALAVGAAPAAAMGSAAALIIGLPALMAVQPARVALAARGRAMALAVAGTLVICAWVRIFPELPETLFGIPRPTAVAGRILGVASMFLALLALGAIQGVSLRRRAVGRGLALLLLTGYLLDQTGNLLVVHTAFLLLVRGTALGAPDVELWRGYMAALARRVEAGEPVVIGLRGEEVSRMRIEQGPIDLRLARRGDEIVQIDVTAGSPPRSAPTWSARHRAASQPRSARLAEAGGGARSDLPSEFRRQLVVRGDGAQMLDDELQRLLLALPPGALAVWPAEGVRWRAFPASTSTPDRPVAMCAIETGSEQSTADDLVGVVRVVREVALRAGVRC